MGHVQMGEAWLILYLTIRNILLKKAIVLVLRTYSDVKAVIFNSLKEEIPNLVCIEASLISKLPSYVLIN